MGLSRGYAAKLGFTSEQQGSLDTLAFSLGSDLDAINRTGFFSDLTVGAECLHAVVGGTEAACFHKDNGGAYAFIHGRIAISDENQYTPSTTIHARRNTNTGLRLDTFSNTPAATGGVQFYKARGNISNPAGVQTNDTLGFIGAYGARDNGSFITTSRANIFFHAAENWGASAHGTYALHRVTPIGSDTPITAIGVYGDRVDIPLQLAVNTIAERTAASGVTIDGLLVRDGGLTASDAITTRKDADAQYVGLSVANQSAGNSAFAEFTVRGDGTGTLGLRVYSSSSTRTRFGVSCANSGELIHGGGSAFANMFFGSAYATTFIFGTNNVEVFRLGSTGAGITLASGKNLTMGTSSTLAAQALTATTITGSGVLTVTDATEATSSAGSIRTSGGISAAKKIYAGGTITTATNIGIALNDAASPFTSESLAQGFVALGSNGYALVLAGSATTSSLVSGGVVGEALRRVRITADGEFFHGGGAVAATSTMKLLSGSVAIGATTLVGSEKLRVAGAINTSGVLTVTDATEATSVAGSILTSGGISAAKGIYAGGNLTMGAGSTLAAQALTATTGTFSGSIVGGYPASTTPSLDLRHGWETMIIGADSASSTRTDATGKAARIGIPHYLNSEQRAAFLYAATFAASNELHIGGGTSAFNAATHINIWAAANTVTTTGSLVATFTVSALTLAAGYNLTMGASSTLAAQALTATSGAFSSRVGVNGGSNSIGAICVATATTTISGPAAWSSEHAVLGGPANSPASTGLGVGVDRALDDIILFAITPGTAWRKLRSQASEHHWHLGGASSPSASLTATGVTLAASVSLTMGASSTLAAQALTATTISASGKLTITDTTEATSSAGSILTSGGISAAKGGYFGGAITTANSVVITASVPFFQLNDSDSSARDFRCVVNSDKLFFQTDATADSGAFDRNVMTIDGAANAVAIGSTALVGSERLRVAAGSAATAGATDVCIGAGVIDMGVSLRYRGTQVVGAQGAAVANATDAASVITQLNTLLSRLRTHGLIAT